MPNIARPADHDEPIVPRPGWTLEDEYRALSAEFLKVEDNRDRLASQLEGAVEDLREVLGMIDSADRGDWDQTIPTLGQYARTRLRELEIEVVPKPGRPAKHDEPPRETARRS